MRLDDPDQPKQVYNKSFEKPKTIPCPHESTRTPKSWRPKLDCREFAEFGSPGLS